MILFIVLILALVLVVLVIFVLPFNRLFRLRPLVASGLAVAMALLARQFKADRVVLCAKNTLRIDRRVRVRVRVGYMKVCISIK